MKAVSRTALSVLLALATCFGAFALVGCGGSAPSSSAASVSAQSAEASSQSAAATDGTGSASDDADDEEQDNCYGDDMPAKKS